MSDLLEKAISKGSTVWLKKLLANQLPKLPTDIVACEAWFNSLIKAFEARGLTEPEQQKNYLTQARNAIKVINSEHPALDVVKFDKETWVEINNAATDRIAERNTKFISNPEIIVSKAKKLITSFDWASIAAGIAVLTGRRSSEVIKTAKFEYKTRSSVVFSGSLKRKNEPIDVVFEIPTLCEAKLIINAIANLRKFLGDEIEELSINQVSGRYSRAVSVKCDQHFADLVPRREGEDNLYSHLFRAVYATIASYWYCPPTVPEMEYRAAIQGHYQILDEKNPVLRRNLAASRHYFDYKIGDGMGNIDGRLGIKLGELGVEVIEQFARGPTLGKLEANSAEEKPASDQAAVNNNRDKHAQVSKKTTMNETITIPKYLIPRFHLLSQKLGLSEKDTIEALFDWAELSLSLGDILEIDELKPNVLYDRVESLKVQAEQNSSLNQQNIVENSNDNRDENLLFDADSIRDLCSSVKLLSKIVADSQKHPLFNQETDDQKPSAKSVSEIDSTDKTRTKKVKSQKQSGTDNIDGRTTSSRTVEAELVINHAIDQLKEFNEQEGISHKDKFKIGIGALKKMTGKGDGVIRRVLESREKEIEEHHQIHQLGTYHNSKGKEATPVDELVPLDEDFLEKEIAALHNHK